MNRKFNNKQFNEIPLDDYEKELRVFLDKGKYHKADNLVEAKKMFEEAAKNYLELQETKSVTLRVKKKDLIRVKARAKRNNIPYQTLIGLLINRYAEGDSELRI